MSSYAAQKLSSHFVALRKQVQQVERDNNERSSIPITVRQLEAIIRISESLAKIELKTEVLDAHVDEAIRLFKFSTMDAVRAGNIDGMSKGELMEEIEAIEKDLRQRNKLGTGRTMPYSSLRNYYVQQRGSRLASSAELLPSPSFPSLAPRFPFFYRNTMLSRTSQTFKTAGNARRLRQASPAPLFARGKRFYQPDPSRPSNEWGNKSAREKDNALKVGAAVGLGLIGVWWWMTREERASKWDPSKRIAGQQTTFSGTSEKKE
ncbi:hypothetical protein JCM10213_007876 [Rhodosporidiobolus nylandii]